MKKKRLILSGLILIFTFNFVSALELTINKDSYYPRETMLGEITGNFISFKSENIFIYEEEKMHSSPVIKGLTKQNNTYYFYVIVPEKAGNYSLRIENSEYIKDRKLESAPLIKSFTIKNTNQSYISINPGFIIANRDFSVKVIAVNKNQDVEAKFEATGETKKQAIVEDNQETFTFSIAGLNPGKSILKVGSYSIPIFIISKLITYDEIIKLNVNPVELTGTIIAGNDYSFRIILENSGNKNLTNIIVINNLNALVTPDKISVLEAGESSYIDVKIPVPAETKDKLAGSLNITFGNLSIEVPALFNITKNVSEIKLNNTGISQSLSCLDIGRICIENQECIGEITSSLEGPCCKGECIENKKTDYKWIIGVVLIIILVAALGFLYRKAKQKGKSRTVEDVLRERNKKYDEKIIGEEVKDRLDRF